MTTEIVETTPNVDGVRLAVLTSRFEGVVDAMMNTLFRTGRSNVLNTGRDFSCCVVTKDHELLVSGESIPIHVMSGPDVMARTMKERHPDLRAGDAFLHNSPYEGNSHAADYSMLVPVIDEDGTHQFTVVAKAHQADCGNSVPTTYAAMARDVYEEGALIFPCVKVQEDFRDNEDIIRMCRARIRVPEQWYGDYLALLGAARIGQRRLMDLGAEIGWDQLQEYTRDWFAYSEHRMVNALRSMRSGSVTTTSAHDPFPGVPDGIPVKAEVALDAESARITVDLRDNPDCQPCGLNLSAACAETAAMMAVFNSIEHTIPKNAGSFRRIDVLLRENCVAGIPSPTASCSLATTGVADRELNAVQRGIAELDTDVGMAEAGGCLPPSVAVISGVDPRRGGAEFVNELVLPALTGGPGTPHSDGWLTMTHAGSAGVQMRDSTEIDELRYPIVIWSQRLMADTEGAGKYRGAPSAYAEYGPVDTWMQVAYASDGTVNPALGAAGGLPGGLADQSKRLANGDLVKVDACAEVRLDAGERIVSVSAAGGGYGDPMDRPVARVVRDVAEGWVTPERAREVYGVAVSSSGELDRKETERLRSAQRS
jgi:N-methylhydantoinase B